MFQRGARHANWRICLRHLNLSRVNADWHRLIELAALSHTLILDEDGIYDPAHFNDRLLLGLRGTMSEAELNVLKARLQSGIRNKARSGELELPLPIGLVHGANRSVVRDPDRQSQDTSRRPVRYFTVGSAAESGRLLSDYRHLCVQRNIELY